MVNIVYEFEQGNQGESSTRTILFILAATRTMTNNKNEFLCPTSDLLFFIFRFFYYGFPILVLLFPSSATHAHTYTFLNETEQKRNLKMIKTFWVLFSNLEWKVSFLDFHGKFVSYFIFRYPYC